ncbi:MAG: phosphate ABC transporter substrate-binding protein [Deltaproteobacteria bacterium]|nr:phosphate ABC transporter substrate-binding protein [Deltaproteobacteria bacterium]
MRRLTLLVVAVLAGTLGCRGQESQEASGGGPAVSGKIKALGSSTVLPLAKSLADAFAKAHPGTEFEIEQSNSNWGLGALRPGMTDIALSTKPPGEDDKALVAHRLGRDGLCVIVHKSNPVEALSDDQLRGIFQGKIVNWKEVGGNDTPIVRLNHSEVRTSLVLFVAHLGLQVSDMKYTDIVIGSDSEGVQLVSNKPEAMTYLSIASALGAVAGGSPLKLIGLRGVAPTVANVENGTVPVVYDVSLITKDAPNPQTRAFVEFATSPATADMRKEKNFAPAVQEAAG